MIYGFPHSWNWPVAISGTYGSYAWSPCGQFFSAFNWTSVEIWDSLTLEKHFSFQLTKPDHETWDPESECTPPGVLTYSPDGHFLAGYFSSVIIMWDVQTGGVVEEIECGVINILPQRLVWSSDEKTICSVFLVEAGTWAVFAYDVALGVKVSTSTFLSSLEPYIWPHNDFLQVVTMPSNGDVKVNVNIFMFNPHSWMT